MESCHDDYSPERRVVVSCYFSHQDYMAGIGHQTAAIEDSRLMPMTELTISK
ncbi:hypothetical protein [Lysinibacillus sp. NPDC092081]|uniref:hypothetical protein n=1 Tax=Lysinibacillus sp. NPDC092081 TaxID=3364131 RepID=UPI0038027F8E